MSIDYTLIAVVGAICITAIIIGGNWLKTGRTAHPAILKSEKNWEKYARDLEEQLDQAEKEIKSLVGKINAKDSPPQFKGELTKDNFAEMISGIFPMFADKIPSFLQPFFKNPMLQKWIIQYGVDHPEQAISMFQKFFSKDLGRPSKNQSSGEMAQSTEQNQLPPGSELF